MKKLPEFINALHLTTLKLKMLPITLYWLLPCTVLVVDIFYYIYRTLIDEGGAANVYTSLVFSSKSTVIMMITLVLSLLTAFFYKQINAPLIVFPQTKKSRFLSEQLIQYGILLWVLSFFSVKYICELLLALLFDRFSSGAVLLFLPKASHILMGIAVMFLYAVIFVALINFAVAIIKKFGMPGSIIMFIFACLIFAHPIGKIYKIDEMDILTGFIFKESSFILFTIKSILLALVLFFVTILLNYNTSCVSHFETGRNSVKTSFSYIFAALAMLLPYAFFDKYLSETEHTAVYYNILEVEKHEYIDESITQRIDFLNSNEYTVDNGEVRRIEYFIKINAPYVNFDYFQSSKQLSSNNNLLPISSQYSLKPFLIHYNYRYRVFEGKSLKDIIKPMPQPAIFRTDANSPKIYYSQVIHKEMKGLFVCNWQILEQFSNKYAIKYCHAIKIPPLLELTEPFISEITEIQE